MRAWGPHIQKVLWVAAWSIPVPRWPVCLISWACGFAWRARVLVLLTWYATWVPTKEGCEVKRCSRLHLCVGSCAHFGAWSGCVWSRTLNYMPNSSNCLFQSPNLFQLIFWMTNKSQIVFGGVVDAPLSNYKTHRNHTRHGCSMSFLVRNQACIGKSVGDRNQSCVTSMSALSLVSPLVSSIYLWPKSYSDKSS